MTSIERAKASAPLWGSLLVSGGAWSVHLIASHFLVEAVCAPVSLAGSGEAIGSPAWLPLVILTVVAAAVSFVAALYAWGRRHRLRSGGAGLARSAPLAPVIAALSLFFTLAILMEGVPLFVVACGGG